MLRLTIALMVGILMACDGGDKDSPLSLSSTTVQPDYRTSEVVRPTSRIDATLEAGTAQLDIRGQSLEVSPQITLTLGAGSELEARRSPAVGTQSPSVPVVTLDGVPFQVGLAITSDERMRGLSGHPPLASGIGMLFVYEQPLRTSFWMRGMLFPLDMIWIGRECKVVHITRNAPPPAPDQDLADLPRYGPEVPILYVLEINAGEADSAGVAVGSTAKFAGSLTGRFSC